MSRQQLTNRLLYMDAPAGSAAVDPLSSTVRRELMKLPPILKFHVTEADCGRPAYISYRRYGTVDLWFLVMEYNGIMHHLDLEPGTYLELPEYSAVVNVLKKARAVSTRVGDEADGTRRIAQRRIVVA